MNDRGAVLDADDSVAIAEPVIEETRPQPMVSAVGAIERTVRAIRIVPLLLVLAALWWGQTLLIPIVLSILISYALEPAVTRLHAWHVPRLLAVPLLLAALIGSIGAVTYLLRGEAIAFADRIPGAAHKLAQAIHHQRSDGPGPVAQLQQAANELEQAAATHETAPPRNGVTSVRIEEPTFKLSDWVWQGSHGAANMAGQLFAIVCLVYYLLVSGDMYKRKLVRIVGPTLSHKKTTVQILDEIDRQIARFLWARVVISGIVSVAIYVGFRVLGLESPGVWAVLSAFLVSIPVVGPLLLVVGSGIAGFIQFESIGLAAATVGFTTIIMAIEGNVLTPVLMSRVGEMNAVAVFLSLMFWGWIWGIWGLLLAVPITAAMKAVCERLDSLNPIAEFLRAEQPGRS